MIYEITFFKSGLGINPQEATIQAESEFTLNLIIQSLELAGFKINTTQIAEANDNNFL